MTRTPTAGPRITPGPSRQDKFSDLATAVLFDRLCGSVAAAAADYFPHSKISQLQPGGPKPAGYEALQNAPLSFFAKQCVMAAGVNLPPWPNMEDVATQALQQGGGDILSFGSELYAGGPQLNRPGDFPNLLANLSGKILDMALQLADPTYPVYTKRISDRPDFKPATVLQGGQFTELDLILDGKAARELAMAEELGGWLQIDRYGNKVGLTPIMVANDDLDAWAMQLASLGYAHEQTLNRLALSLVTANVVLLDGFELFDNTNHGNDVTSGGAPDATEAGKMRQKHLLQTGVGGVGKLRTPPAVAMVPVELQDEAEQTYLSPGVLLEAMMKRPSSDSNINVHRGKVTPVVEPELSDASSVQWYTFANPNIRPAIVHAFQTGYGPGGQRTSWFEPDTSTRWTKLEGRFAVAAISHRGAVRNAGQ